MTALRTQAEVALTRARSPESYRDSLGAMLEDVARLERLVDTLLQLARGDAGMVQAQWASVDLGAARESAGGGADTARANRADRSPCSLYR